MTGTVLWGVNNIFYISAENTEWECRIKGKVLKNLNDSYNPLSPGDIVEFEPAQANQGLILSRHPRKNAFQRWNKKRNAPQTVAANLDMLFCLTSPDNPPFRPRFIDRAMVIALRSEIPFSIIVNKSDLPISEEARARLDVYEKMNFQVLYCSAVNNIGIDVLREKIIDLRCGFIGQSGVGKSSVLNALDPAGRRNTGDVSRKYNRGAHTTVYSIMTPLGSRGGGLIDTPGIREIEVFDIELQDLKFYFPDLQQFGGDCAFSSCLHRDEPDCAVRNALKNGKLHPDRYESYLRILESLQNDMVV